MYCCAVTALSQNPSTKPKLDIIGPGKSKKSFVNLRRRPRRRPAAFAENPPPPSPLSVTSPTTAPVFYIYRYARSERESNNLHRRIKSGKLYHLCPIPLQVVQSN